MTRDSLVFMLSAFTGTETNLVLEENSILIPCNDVTSDAKPLFEEMSQSETYLAAYSLMKNFLKTGAYQKAQYMRHSKFLLPPTLSRLEEQLHFKSWESETVEWSQVKGKTRILYRSPKEYPKMSIAQTVEEGGNIRETEIILKREDGSGNYDFYAYDREGRPALRSHFFNASSKETSGPVPHTCMSCHYDGHTRFFQTSPASFHP